MRIWNAPDTILNSNKNALAIVVQERERIFWSAGINGELTRSAESAFSLLF